MPKDTAKNSDYLLSSVKNALKVLLSFSDDEPEKGISELSRQLQLGKSRVHRLVTTLVSEGFLTQNPETQRYRLGMSILHLNGILTANLELNDVAKPYLKHLVEKTGETAHLCVLDNLEVIYTQRIECNHPVRILSSAGRRNPTYCTSSGKVFLAFNNEELILKVIKNGLQTFTPHTITDPEELVASLTKIREEGYALNSEELQEGVVSIAAPIRNHTNEVIAAIGIAAPKQRMDRHKIPGYATILKKAAQEVSRELGYFNRKSYY